MKSALVYVLLLVGILTACDQAKVQASAKPTPHFSVVSGTTGVIAVREDSGQSCKTVNVWCADKEGNMITEGVSESGVSCAVLLELPTCDKIR